MTLPIFQVDAFAAGVFQGNPAAVCPLEQWLPDDVMQAIASENNLAETAFFVKEAEGYRIRWFTPEFEINLCGHATLASAHVLFRHLGLEAEQIVFQSKSGPLEVSRNGELITLNFPAYAPKPVPAPRQLLEGLGFTPRAVFKDRDYLALLENEEQVLEVRPDMGRIAELDAVGLIITAPGTDCDFVSRFFAPAAGIPEDPVTGSAHCMLVPYWAKRYSKNQLLARQVSKRGGELLCELRGDRVLMSGKAVTYLSGEITF
jgi:PhzF family phenazine biosynthesis protein